MIFSQAIRAHASGLPRTKEEWGYDMCGDKDF